MRYLSCVISRFSTVTSAELRVPASDDTERGSVERPHGPREEPARDQAFVDRASEPEAGRAGARYRRSSAAVFEFYASLIGDAPYPSFTLAVSESDLPGGHSPAYFALLNQTLPTHSWSWRNDPVSFDSYPTFFLAHEIAHQWWGQARRLEELPRAVAERGLRAVLRGAVCRERARTGELRAACASDAQVGDGHVGAGAGLSRLPARPHQE